MSRRSSRHKKYISGDKNIIMPPNDFTGSDSIEERSPESTYVNVGTNIETGYDKEQTTAPEIGVEEESEQYAQSTAELIDKRVFSGKSIPFIVILIIMGIIFVQDNNAKILNNWKDILWSIQKCLFFVFLYVLFLLSKWISRGISWCYNKLFKEKSSIE